jgi:hypothetical protein
MTIEDLDPEEGARPGQTASAQTDRFGADRPDPSDMAIAFTPRQILGGFALLAALVMLLRRRNRDRDHERD